MKTVTNATNVLTERKNPRKKKTVARSKYKFARGDKWGNTREEDLQRAHKAGITNGVCVWHSLNSVKRLSGPIYKIPLHLKIGEAPIAQWVDYELWTAFLTTVMKTNEKRVKCSASLCTLKLERGTSRDRSECTALLTPVAPPGKFPLVKVQEAGGSRRKRTR